MAALAVSPLDNIREEIPLSGHNTPRRPQTPIEDNGSPQIHPPLSPTIPRRPRGASVVSRVSLDYFDPSGVDELRRTMSRQSEISKKGKHTKPSKSPQDGSEVTLPVDEPFDFEKSLGEYIQR